MPRPPVAPVALTGCAHPHPHPGAYPLSSRLCHQNPRLPTRSSSTRLPSSTTGAHRCRTCTFAPIKRGVVLFTECQLLCVISTCRDGVGPPQRMPTNISRSWRGPNYWPLYGSSTVAATAIDRTASRPSLFCAPPVPAKRYNKTVSLDAIAKYYDTQPQCMVLFGKTRGRRRNSLRCTGLARLRTVRSPCRCNQLTAQPHANTSCASLMPSPFHACR